MRRKYIYVILTQSLTMPGKIIRKFTGGQYSHASISLDKDLNEMYSFARFKYHTPLVAGFTKENITTLSLGKEDGVNVKIFRIPVTEQQYKKLERVINNFKNNSGKYMYNLFGLLFFKTPIEFNIRDTYICTEFVSKCIASLGIKKKKLNKNRITPEAMIEALKEYEYFDGDLTEYSKKLQHNSYTPEFLEKENFVLVILKSIKQILCLIYRKII